ncbi:MAG: polysaccharide pyruvyl transferase family protein [Cytophagales bacterium]|nr:polysaccharide pyruvyl transferase family protein [Armatimonadota bacterium]
MSANETDMTETSGMVSPPRRRPHILLCSAWQNVNIGDIAHTPGALALLEEYLPDVDVTLWAYTPLTSGAAAMIRQRFPRVSIVTGTVSPDDQASNEELGAALSRADFFLHGSGPAMLGWAHAEAFSRCTGRPFGVYGVTYGLYGIPEKATLSRTRFTYFRESVSLETARRDGVQAPIMEFAPDAAFAFNQRDEVKAITFLRDHDLEEGNFLCCISRLRYTPFWEMSSKNTPFDPARHARNEAKKESDHEPLREAIIAVTRQTTMKVLICPEDETQMRITRENLVERLPKDVLERVVWREAFWLPDEALAVYARSAGLFGSEMHSPIMCIGSGIPAVVCRWEEQSTKGYMWRDIGLGEWLFDLDKNEEASGVAGAVLAIAKDPAAARAKAARARDLVRARFGETMGVVRQEVLAASHGA